MQRTNNYALQAQSAKQRFLTYCQQTILDKHHLPYDENYLYPTMLSTPYRLCRHTGNLEKQVAGIWCDANTFNEVMTVLDWLCDSKPYRCLSGKWLAMHNFGLQFHRNLLENRPNPTADFFDSHPQAFRKACEALHGRPISGADMGYAIELFDGLCIGVQFWHKDEEFFPQLQYFWDANALQYLRYETMYYAVSMLLERLEQERLLF